MVKGVLGAALALSLVACGGGGGAPEPVSQVAAAPAVIVQPPPPPVVPAAPPRPPGIAPSEVLLDELTTPDHAIDVLALEAYTTPVILPLSAIDLTVDRRELMLRLFARVSAGEADPVLAWLEYLQERIAHPTEPPLHDNGIGIFDPLWILQNRIAHCGQTNRVLVDGLLAAGYRARVVQLRNHQAAEVWVDGDWRFLDADWMNAVVREADGGIASAEDIWRDTSLLDGLDSNEEFARYPVDILPPGFGTYAEMFETKPYYYVKTATRSQERDEYFGWANYYEVQ